MFNKLIVICIVLLCSVHVLNGANCDHKAASGDCEKVSKYQSKCTTQKHQSKCTIPKMNTTQPMTKKQERTLILLKPDAVQRKIIGKIIERFENKGPTLVAMKLFKATKQMAADHYVEHKERPFFGDLMEYMTSRPIIPMVWEGPNVIVATRNMLGVHDPTVSAPGTIRGDFSTDIQNNVIHGSDSVPAANREINIWFDEWEVMTAEN